MDTSEYLLHGNYCKAIIWRSGVPVERRWRPLLEARELVHPLIDSVEVQVRVAQLSEVRRMIEARRLDSLGIGLTDAHLIASVFINPSTLLWTRDRRLRKAAEGLGIHAGLG